MILESQPGPSAPKAPGQRLPSASRDRRPAQCGRRRRRPRFSAGPAVTWSRARRQPGPARPGPPPPARPRPGPAPRGTALPAPPPGQRGERGDPRRSGRARSRGARDGAGAVPRDPPRRSGASPGTLPPRPGPARPGRGPRGSAVLPDGAGWEGRLGTGNARRLSPDEKGGRAWEPEAAARGRARRLSAGFSCAPTIRQPRGSPPGGWELVASAGVYPQCLPWVPSHLLDFLILLPGCLNSPLPLPSGRIPGPHRGGQQAPSQPRTGCVWPQLAALESVSGRKDAPCPAVQPQNCFGPALGWE